MIANRLTPAPGRCTVPACICTAQRALRAQRHAQTLAWMKQFGDTGVLFKELVRRVMVAEDIGPDPGRGDGPFGQGRLKGRPLNVLSGKERKAVLRG